MTGPDDDDAWRDIIANYGDRPVLDPAEAPDAAHDATPEPPQFVESRVDHRVEDRLEDRQEERFVPPPPPPLPRLAPDRLAAWAGVFLSPLVLLLATVLRVHLPTAIAWLLIGGFLGGFGYLVAQMPRGPRDPYDDGARL